LLLPAVQKFNDPSRSPQAGSSQLGKGRTRGRASIDAFYSWYGLNSEESLGSFIAFGGYGVLNLLISSNYDSSGDLDLGSIQLYRSLYLHQMFVVWKNYWEVNQENSIPGTGR